MPAKKKSATRSKTAGSSSVGVAPLGDRVVVAPLGAEEGSKTASGIIIPATVDQERPDKGRVVAVGPGRWNEDGDARVPVGVKVGQKVIFSKYGPDEIKVGDKEYYVVSESNILAVID